MSTEPKENPIELNPDKTPKAWADKILIVYRYYCKHGNKSKFDDSSILNKTKQRQFQDIVSRKGSFKKWVCEYRKTQKINPIDIIGKINSADEKSIHGLINKISKKIIPSAFSVIANLCDLPSNWDYTICHYVFTGQLFVPPAFRIKELGKEKVTIEIFSNTTLNDIRELWGFFKIEYHQKEIMRQGFSLKKMRYSPNRKATLMLYKGGETNTDTETHDDLTDPSVNRKRISRIKPYLQ